MTDPASTQLWVDWIEEGYAPTTVINNSQNTTWEEFVAGGFGFVENGTWQVNAAEEVLVELGLNDANLLGVAKGEERKPGLEQLIFPGEEKPLQLSRDHP